MKNTFIQISNISFSYDSQIKPLFKSISLHLSTGWTGIIGANGAGKSTFLKLCAGHLDTQEGHIIRPASSIYCEQRTDHLPENIEDFIYSYDKGSIRLKSILNIQEDQIYRWESLSHGERKRLQIGNALYQNPDLLAIDEPTNHLDDKAKKAIQNALKRYQRIGLIVSHDRALMDALCTQCLFINSSKPQLFRGNYSQAKSQYELKQQYQSKKYYQLEKEKKRINSIINDRKQIAMNSDKRVSKKGIAKKDSDSRAKINLAKLTGKDAVGGKLMKQKQNTLKHISEKQKNYHAEKQNLTGVHFKTKSSQRNCLFYAASFEIPLGEKKKLFINDLSIDPSDKIGLTGNNGCGKSTLVHHILEKINLEKEKILYIPQEIKLSETRKIKNKIKKMNHEKLGKLMTIIKRLGSDPKRLLESELYSPGETRKLMFGFGVIKLPQLIVMDEPTNHLDIITIECLEKALVEVNSALLLVSHDEVFLNKLVNKRWHIDKSDNHFVLNNK